MNIVTHALLSWCIAQRTCKTDRDAALASAAGLIPDLDGAGALVDLARGGEAEYFSMFHHILGHNIFTGISVAVFLAAFAAHRVRVAATAGLLFALHVACDVIGARGPDGESWPIPWLYPIRSDSVLQWDGQWEINAWPNIVFTIFLMVAFLRQTRDLGWSPLRLISERADAVFVSTLRNRFPISTGPS